MPLPVVHVGDPVPVHGHPGEVIGLVIDPADRSLLITVRVQEAAAPKVGRALYCSCRLPTCPSKHAEEARPHVDP